ncbi:helix-turn-helix transcriptional regulator [Allocoleopsis sp.]|uniref:helix-turn-helix domain-containing protein n=1 Tax=Allocoleopsis sp. TaxID=3088169 RepID=UPI002FD2A72F
MNLTGLRKRIGLRIADVSNELNCSLSSIRNWEKGRTTPKMEVWQVFRLRDLYQCTEEELVQAVQESMLSERKQA